MHVAQASRSAEDDAGTSLTESQKVKLISIQRDIFLFGSPRKSQSSSRELIENVTS